MRLQTLTRVLIEMKSFIIIFPLLFAMNSNVLAEVDKVNEVNTDEVKKLTAKCVLIKERIKIWTGYKPIRKAHFGDLTKAETIARLNDMFIYNRCHTLTEL